ncbi:MAG TPA: hypothetical protein PKM65_10235 [Spirochaetota bacterium]|nr:hypothetical protein [Spirochaetota bacterium]HNT12323.1 hypothetical protein [Spirochaetota bacterium]HNV46793.1 hypothetical protein [Spirochaetota bacterium]HOS41604.1 hypothetical protein [Spirochaetota bacterium]HPU89243.1 hypothetical protein [Spirochaetota bacterium]
MGGMQNVPSAAAQVIVTIVPIVGIVMGSVVIFFYLLYAHREKMLMIRERMYTPKKFDLPVFSLFAGLLLTAIGACLIAFFLIKEGFAYSVLSGMIPFAVGASLLIFFKLYTSMRGGPSNDAR